MFFALLLRKGFISYRKHFHYLVAGGVAGMILLTAVSSKIADRLLNTPPTPLYTRALLNRLAFSQIAAHPFAGVGLNNFAESGRKMLASIPDPHNVLYLVSDNPIVHNLYLLVLAEIGTLGFIVFLLLLLGLLREAWRSVQAGDRFISSTGIGIVCFIAGFLVAEIFDFSYRLDQVFYLFWALGGLTVALGRIRNSLPQQVTTGLSPATGNTPT